MFYILISAFVAPIVLFLLLIGLSKFLFIKKALSSGMTTSISAGLLTSLTFFKFLPHSLESTTPFMFSTIFLCSLALLIIIEVYIIPFIPFSKIFPQIDQTNPRCHHDHNYHHHISHSQSFSTIGCLLSCTFFDGVRFGSALFVDSQTMIFTSLALLAHLLPEGLSVLGLARSSYYSKRAYFFLQFLLCIFLSLGILLNGISHFEKIEHWISIFSTASLFYVVFIHLAPFVLKKENHRLFFITLLVSSVSMFFLESH